MGIFDFLSGSDEAERAAEANRAALAGYGRDVGNLYGSYQTGALGALGEARTGALGELETGLSRQVPALTAGFGEAAGAGQAGVAAYAPLSRLGESYAPAVNAYTEALGLAGPEGVARTQQRFTTSPGYQFAVDEATRAAMANASRLGIAGSGNTLDAIRARAQGFASQEYGDYLNRLQGFVNPQLQATTGAAQGIAGANRTLADIYSGRGGALADVYGRTAGARAGLQTGYGGDVTGVLGNVTGGRAQSLRDITQGNIAANQAIAQAGQQDAANLWGLLGNIAGNATKAATAGMGGGGGSSATGSFGATSGNLAAPYYATRYGTPGQLFPGYGTA